ncbi:SgcJ/EcaC family oxidoreductase [Mumia sp. zg.B53]|uniref:SgcJ/EcaC family oxidoreductase n=1 Tax=Mumia sp. zg.B53 TaxID=2855449 RepID=UPI001C6F31B1|nr:SgcJ/EcaC family oxidoreductase [Mumia sp. zg.B53]MBW9216105.1 SgcJ/EcaC family oxidoreductase [Mumia sp. zg.B53]
MEHESDIRSVITRWIDAVDRGTDLEAVLADHTDDIVMFDVPPPYEGVRGMKAYEASWSDFLAWQRGDGQFVLESLEVTAGDDVAFAHGLVLCRARGSHDEHPDQRLRLTLGLRRVDGRWLIAHEHHSFTEDSGRRDSEGEAEVAAVLSRWHEDTAAKDLDAMMAGIAQDVTSYELEEPLLLRELEDVRESCRRGLEATAGRIDFDVVDPQIVVRGDLAAVWSLDRVAVTQDGDDDEATTWSRATRVFRRRDGRWLLVHQHLSYPLAAGTDRVRLDLRPVPDVCS